MTGPVHTTMGPSNELFLPAADATWLAPLLDVRRVAASLARVAKSGAPAVSNCTVRHVRYRPGTSCTVLYDIELQAAAPGAVRSIYARALAPGRGLPPVTTGFGNLGDPRAALLPIPVRLPDSGIVLREFPADATLPGLPQVQDMPRLAQDLVAAIAETGPLAAVVSFDFRQLRYKPEHRLLLRTDLRWREHGTNVLSAHTCQVRFEYGGNRERRADISAQLAAALPASGLLTPPGLERVLPALDCTTVAWQEGTDLSRRLRQGETEAAAGAGQALAAIAGVSLGGMPRQTPTNALQDAAHQVEALHRHPPRPGLAERFDELIGVLADRECPYTEGLVHGDFHQGQLLDQGDHFCVVDWDRVHHGDPACDHGRFLAQLHLLELNGRTAAAPLATAFRDAHAGHGGERPSADRECFWTVLALVNLALREIRRLRPGWEHQVDLHLDRATWLLQRRDEP